MSDSLTPHEPQHTRPPCPSPTPRVHPNPCPSSWWCHPTISSSVVPFSSCPQSFPASGSFQMNQLFASGSQSIGVSASTAVCPILLSYQSRIGHYKKERKKERKENETRVQSLKWVDAKFFIKLWKVQHIIRIVYCDQVKFIPWIQTSINICKLINVTYHSNKWKIKITW